VLIPCAEGPFDLVQLAKLIGGGKRFLVHADGLLTAFLELQRAIHEFAVSLILYPFAK
jgi:hypothetical protein